MASSTGHVFFGVGGSNPTIHNNKLFQTFPMTSAYILSLIIRLTLYRSPPPKTIEHGTAVSCSHAQQQTALSTPTCSSYYVIYLYVSGGGMNCVSCDICVYHLGLFVFFPRVFLSSRVTGACPATTDLIMRVNVRTTTTTTTYCANK